MPDFCRLRFPKICFWQFLQLNVIYCSIMQLTQLVGTHRFGFCIWNHNLFAEASFGEWYFVFWCISIKNIWQVGIHNIEIVRKVCSTQFKLTDSQNLHALWECNVAIRPVAIPLKLESWCRLMVIVMTDRTGFCTQIQPAAVWYTSKSIHILCFLLLRNQM